MDEIEKRAELTMNVMDATSISHFSLEKLRDESCRKISLGQLTAFGVAFEPLVAAIQAITGNAEQGTSGIYYVNTKDKQMMQFHDGWTIVNKKDTIFKYIFWERLDSLPIPEGCFHFIRCQIS